jgi:hypothetical protein
MLLAGPMCCGRGLAVMLAVDRQIMRKIMVKIVKSCS